MQLILHFIVTVNFPGALFGQVVIDITFLLVLCLCENRAALFLFLNKRSFLLTQNRFWDFSFYSMSMITRCSFLLTFFYFLWSNQLHRLKQCIIPYSGVNRAASIRVLELSSLWVLSVLLHYSLARSPKLGAFFMDTAPDSTEDITVLISFPN